MYKMHAQIVLFCIVTETARAYTAATVEDGMH